MAYARGTKTAIETTEGQIKKMLQKAGAGAIAFMEEPGRAVIAFHLHDRAIQFRLPLPVRGAPEFTHAVMGARGLQRRSADAADNAWVQASRERWRQLHLCIKAKLEAVEQHIETFDEAFLPHIVMPDGDTIGDKVIGPMREQIAGAPMRPLLPPPRKDTP